MAFRNKFTNSLILSMLPPSSLVLDPFWLNSVGIWDSMLLITCTFIQSHSSPFLSALPSLKSAWLNVTGDSNCKCTDWGLTYFWLKHRGQCLEKSVPSNRCWIQKKKKKRQKYSSSAYTYFIYDSEQFLKYKIHVPLGRCMRLEET